MKRIETNINGIAFYVEQPSSIEEFNQLHGSATAVLERANDYINAHIILSKVRAKVAEKLTELGFPLATKLVGDKEVTVKADKAWFDKAFATLAIAPADRAALVQEAADEVGYDVSGRQASSGATGVDKKAAKQLISAIGAGQSTFARVKGNLESRNPGLEIEVEEDGSITEDNLALALKTERKRVEATAAHGLLG